MSEIKIPISSRPDISWTLSYLDNVDSTNSAVSNLAKQGMPEGQVVLADHQSAGRGRLDRSWVDIPGNSVLMSVLLRPKFPPQFFFLITSSLSLAALEILESEFSIPCKLKWPNDVMVADKKIAGVLAEAAFDGSGNPWVVVGIGLNCRQSSDQLSQFGNATSILAETGVVLDNGARLQLAEAIATRFAGLYYSLESDDGRNSTTGKYRNACDTIGSLVRVEMTGETFVGTATNISVEGNLLIETESLMRAVSAGDVVHLRKAPQS